MSRCELVVLAFQDGSDYADEAVADPIGFLDVRGPAMNRVAFERLHSQRILPVAKGSPWALVLPGDDVDLTTVAGMYGDELAVLLRKACEEQSGAVLAWKVVDVVPKGLDGASAPARAGW